jgi:hypothetical protein
MGWVAQTNSDLAGRFCQDCKGRFGKGGALSLGRSCEINRAPRKARWQSQPKLFSLAASNYSKQVVPKISALRVPFFSAGSSRGPEKTSMADSLGTWGWSNEDVYLGSQYESQMHLEPVFASPNLQANANASAERVADTLIDPDDESQDERGIVEPLGDACRLPAIILDMSQSQGVQKLRAPGVPVSWQGDYSETQKLEPDSLKDKELGNSSEMKKQKPDFPEDDAQGKYNETQEQSQGVQESRSPGAQHSSQGNDSKTLCDGQCHGLCNKQLCNNVGSQKTKPESAEAPGAKRPKSVSGQFAIAKLLASSSYLSDLE